VVQLVSGGVAGEQVSFQMSSESVNRWRCSNGEWQTVPDARSRRTLCCVQAGKAVDGPKIGVDVAVCSRIAGAIDAPADRCIAICK